MPRSGLRNVSSLSVEVLLTSRAAWTSSLRRTSTPSPRASCAPATRTALRRLSPASELRPLAGRCDPTSTTVASTLSVRFRKYAVSSSVAVPCVITTPSSGASRPTASCTAAVSASQSPGPIAVLPTERKRTETISAASATSGNRTRSSSGSALRLVSMSSQRRGLPRPIVGLAAEVEPLDVEIVEVSFAGDLATGVVVEILHTAGAVAVVVQALAPAHRVDHTGLAVLLGQREQPRPVQSRRVRVLECVALALLPVADEIGVERACPAGAALQEREVQLGEAAGDAAEEDRLGHGLAGGGEVADVVVAEVRRRVAEQDRARAVVEARRNAQLAELLPHRLVVVLAVDGDRVIPLDELRGLRMLLDQRGDGAANEAPHHDDLVAELL